MKMKMKLKTIYNIFYENCSGMKFNERKVVKLHRLSVTIVYKRSGLTMSM